MRNAQRFLKYFLEPFVIDESHADEFKQYIKKDKELLRPGWTVKQMQAFLNDMMRNRDKEYYQLYHYEDIGRYCSNNYIPNIDHRWYRTQPVVQHKNLDVGPDKFYTNFRQVDENARVQDFLPANIIQVIPTDFLPGLSEVQSDRPLSHLWTVDFRFDTSNETIFRRLILVRLHFGWTQKISLKLQKRHVH